MEKPSKKKSKSLRICFLANADSIHSYRWIRFFAEKGHKIHWISLTPPAFGNIKNVKFYLISGFHGKSLDLFLNLTTVKKLIKKINPDFLHAHYAGFNGLIGTLSGFHPFVLTVWGSDILVSGKYFFKRQLLKFVLRKADLITCDAAHMKKAMVTLGTDAKKIRIVLFGTDTKKFRPGKKRNALRKKLRVCDSPTVISLRSLKKIYDVGSLIRAIPLVLKELPDAKFLILGDGPEEKPLKKLAESLLIVKSTRFVGTISNDKLPDYLALADVYVSTALSDAGLAASTAEAMACSLPVIITDTAENKKWVKDGQNGFIVSVKDPEALAKKIIFLLKDKRIREKFGKINRKIIIERNNYFKEMKKMETLYKQRVFWYGQG